MTTSVYVARNFNDPAHFVPSHTVVGTVVGANPLDVADGFAGYVEIENDGDLVTDPPRQVITFQIEHDGISPLPTGDIIGASYDVEYETSGTSALNLALLARGDGYGVLAEAGQTSHPTTWTRYLLPASIAPGEEPYVVDPATTWQIAGSAPGAFTVGYVRVTYLRVLVESDGAAVRHPHQLFQRGDGLGAGAGLVFGPGTRQSTGLVFGTH